MPLLALALLAALAGAQEAPPALDSARLALDSAAFDGAHPRQALVFTAPERRPRVDLRLPKLTPERKGQWAGGLLGVGVSALMEANRKTVDPQNNALTPGGVFVMTGVVLIPFCAMAGGELANWLHARREKRRPHILPIDGENR